MPAPPASSAHRAPHLRVIGRDESPETRFPDFDQIYRRYCPYVATIALRILGDPDEADDVLQDVFLVAHRSLHTVKSAEAIKGWLSTIAVRKSMHRLRRLKMRRFLSSSDAPLVYENLADPGATPEARAEVARLYVVLDGFAAKDRVVWVLRYLEGYTLDEIVLHTGLSKSTVQRRLKKAEEQLDKAEGNSKRRAGEPGGRSSD